MSDVMAIAPRGVGVYLWPGDIYRASVGTGRGAWCCERGHKTPNAAKNCGLQIIRMVLAADVHKWQESPYSDLNTSGVMGDGE